MDTDPPSEQSSSPGFIQMPNPTTPMEAMLLQVIQTQQQQVAAFLEQQQQRATSIRGPKVREPRPYDGDRTEGKLDDHLRDINNWVKYYEARGGWQDEEEAVRACATYLTGKVHRMFEVTGKTVRTMADYRRWLNNCFRDSNEQTNYRDQWAELTQRGRTVIDFVTELLWLGAKIEPPKSQAEIKEQFRTGLDNSILSRMYERPEWDDLPLEEYVMRADRVQQSLHQSIKAATRLGDRNPSPGRFYSIRGSGRAGQSSNKQRPAPGTPMWDDWCKENSACFECGEQGHAVRNCPKRGPNRPQRRVRAPTPARGRSGSRDRSRSRDSNRSRSNSRGPRVAFKQEN